MIRVFTIESELESAKKLGFKTFTESRRPAEWFDRDLIVRWGKSGRLYDREGYRQEFKHVINPASAIRTNCCKHQSIRMIAKVAPTPTIFKLKVPRGKLAVVRPNEHSGGSGFKIIEGPFVIPREHYATEFIETDCEFRVWFAGCKTIYGRRVPIAKGGAAIPVDKYPCRSVWGYDHIYSDPPAELHTAVIAAAKAVGLMLGAADVLFKQGKYYILELNSAPTMDTRRGVWFFQEGIKELATSFSGIVIP